MFNGINRVSRLHFYREMSGCQAQLKLETIYNLQPHQKYLTSTESQSRGNPTGEVKPFCLFSVKMYENSNFPKDSYFLING